MRKEEKINITAVSKRLEILIPKYIESLADQDTEGYTGSFEVFEFDKPLLDALTKTTYAATHLDYDFFMGLIHSAIVSHGIRDPQKVAKYISDYIESTTDHRNWTAIFPFTFNNALGNFFRRKIESNYFEFGVFKIITSAQDSESLSNLLRDNFKIDNFSKADYLHHSLQGSGSIAKCPLIMLDVHGAQESAFNYGKWKVSYLISLLEIYGVLKNCKGISWAKNTIETNHIFLVNKITGEIERSTLRTPTRININPNSDLYAALGDEFITFSNMIINQNDKLFVRLKSALNFFSRGLNGADRVLGFMSYVIAIEAIFSRDKHTPIRITLAEYIALLCYPPEERVSIYDTVKKIYDARSALVHTGKIEVDEELISKAETISAKTILYAFKLYSSLNLSGSEKIEDRFFNHLRDLRLGVDQSEKRSTEY